MPIPSFPIRALRGPLSRRFAALAAVPALLVAAPARADDCAEDYDCGYGFACETVITSVASTGTGGAPGAAGKGGAAGYAGGGGYAGAGFAGGAPRGGAAGAGVGGTFSTGGTANGGSSFGGTSSSGGISGTAGVAGVGGTAPPTMCGNRFCEILAESPETCPLDCAYTTVCNAVPCTSSAQCAGGYICPSSGSAGAGGTGSSGYCGDYLCSGIEDISTCPYDCDPSLRRCTPGIRGCFSNEDCGAGWRCMYLGGASDERPATGGAGGGAGEAFGGGAGASVGGGGAVPAGGANGMVAEGTCVRDDGSTGGFGGVGGTSGGTGATGGTTRGGSDGNGGDGGTDGVQNDEGDVVYTRGGCSLANSSDHSSFAALFVALAAAVGFGRRRRAKARDPNNLAS